MSELPENTGWDELNKKAVTSELELLRRRLENLNSKSSGNIYEEHPGSIHKNDFNDSSLDRICKLFNLTGFEREILLLCAGIELDSRFAALCAAMNESSLKSYCTFSLALSVLSDPHWSAINPYAPLRRWKLVLPESGESITSSRLRIDEKILHYIAGITYLDERLEGILTQLRGFGELSPAYTAIAENAAGILGNNYNSIIQLSGNDPEINFAIAGSTASVMNLNLYALKASDIPSNTNERIMLSRIWEREALLHNSLLLIDDDYSDELRSNNLLSSFIDDTRALIVISGKRNIKSLNREIIFIEVPVLNAAEKCMLWNKMLGTLSEGFNGQVEKASYHFQLKSNDINSISARLLKEKNTEKLKPGLWSMCRSQTRNNMDNLAQRIESNAGWSDLVLPDNQKKTLKEITNHLKESYKVYETWGFRNKAARGLGISTLFTGLSGTGKTLASEILANELQLDLYRIDLSSVVSKYIGDTEKNLKRVFDAAEESGAVLLFDEADALFGKRSEVKDSHDRYANIEVSYLLQRMEQYRGIAILTTNLKNSLDTAFMRRIRFIIHFPFPDKNNRALIWRSIFPGETPLGRLDYEKLSRLSIAGGNIRNIALNAAFIAANNNEAVNMHHLAESAKNEYVKMEKNLTGSEIEGWV